jgi:hypothetical protein
MSAQYDFIISEFWILSWGASVQHARLFVSGTMDSHRREFRKCIISFLCEKIIPDYETADVHEDQHISNIQLLSDEGNIIGEGLLGADGYKIGIAQKLLNLQLKYLWCLGAIREPPHCPIDRIMINKTSLKGQIAWTQITDMDTYRQVIAALKKAAEPTGLTLAQWELKNYNRMTTHYGNCDKHLIDKRSDKIMSKPNEVKMNPPNLWGQQVSKTRVVPPSCNLIRCLSQFP